MNKSEDFESLNNLTPLGLSPSVSLAIKGMSSEMERLSGVGSSLAMGRALENSKLLQDIKRDTLSSSVSLAIKGMSSEMERLSEVGNSLAMGRALESSKLLSDLNRDGLFSSLKLTMKSANNMIEQLDSLSKPVSLEYIMSDFIRANSIVTNTLPNSYIENIKSHLNSIDTLLETQSEFSNFDEEYYLESIGLSQAETYVKNVAPLLNQNNSIEQYKVIESLLIEINEKLKNESMSEKAKKGIVKWIMEHLILILLAPWFNPFIGVYNDWVGQNTTQIIRTIKKDIREESDIHDYHNQRIVTKHNLEVKLTNQKKSPTIAQISLGEIVEVTYKKRNWTKIRIDDGYIIIEGWVFTRYIDKIK